MEMYIPKYFSLAELLHSDTAVANDIENFPSWNIIEKLRILAARLDFYRAEIGEAIFVSSGYRCPILNVMVGGSPTSHHAKGDAADIQFRKRDKKSAIELYNLIKSINEKYDLDIDQMFLEYKKSTGSWWVHLGLNVDDGGIHMRNQYGNLNV